MALAHCRALAATVRAVGRAGRPVDPAAARPGRYGRNYVAPPRTALAAPASRSLGPQALPHNLRRLAAPAPAAATAAGGSSFCACSCSGGAPAAAVAAAAAAARSLAPTAPAAHRRRPSACRGAPPCPGLRNTAGGSSSSSSSCSRRRGGGTARAAAAGAAPGEAAAGATSPAAWDPAAVPAAPAPLLGDWSEHAVWQAAIESVVGPGESAAAAALLRSLAGLRLLLPDLEPHWGEQLGVQQKLVTIEHILAGTAAASASSPGAPSAPSAASSPSDAGSWDVCLYGEAQRAAGELRGLAPFFRQYGTRATESCYQHSSWVLGEALMGAARNYSGPGSTLLRARDLEVAAVAVRGLRRAHEGHLGSLVRLQCRLALALPQVGQRLVELRSALAAQPLTGPGAVAVDVGHLAATNLALLLPPAYTAAAATATATATATAVDSDRNGNGAA
ncbi:hypothetical protein HXX76_015154 [Chlamydomonas incerta]|uniref:Uncharacterized protein n=1 Tax=Chlamydomonas incerta TaxID=51695 RepID=A0A835SAC8_CHLIN|nr:hypothetical protein HXX76_015154 [Chlamydomonas incerta]|eukprot:KAG2423637.1 hypothetical protein HXX76_015154 [Chlamydomonas incerta]